MLFNLFRRRPKRKPIPVTLTEREFNLLAEGVHSGGLLGAWSTDVDRLSLAVSLVSKGCIYRTGSLPVGDRTYITWNFTSQGTDAALGGFTPAPGWFPFGADEGH